MEASRSATARAMWKRFMVNLAACFSVRMDVWGNATRTSADLPKRLDRFRRIGFQPRHARAQRRADLLDRMLEVGLLVALVVGQARGVFGGPGFREGAVLDFLQHVLHPRLHAGVDDARTADVVAVLRGLGHVLQH